MPFDATNLVTTLPNPVTETEAQRILRKAKAMLKNQKCWSQSSTSASGPGKACAATAISRVAQGYRLSEPAPLNWTVDAVYALGFLHRAAGLGLGNVPNWNDCIDTEHADVLAAFDRAYVLAAQPHDPPQEIG